MKKRFTDEQIIGILKEQEAVFGSGDHPPPWDCGANILPLEVEVRRAGTV